MCHCCMLPPISPSSSAQFTTLTSSSSSQQLTPHPTAGQRFRPPSNAHLASHLLNQHNIRCKIIPVGLLQCNCTILADNTTKHGVIVDAGGEASKIVEYVIDQQLVIDGIYITHGHFDHFTVVGEVVHALKQHYNDDERAIPVYLHHSDHELYTKLEQQLQMMGNGGSTLPRHLPPIDVHFVSHNDPIPLLNGTVLHTPGHSPGSICLHFPALQLMCTGDTLFHFSIGRTDLWGGSYSSIVKSITSLYEQIDEQTVVIPGHHELTMVGLEKYYNPYVQLKQQSAL